VPDYYYPATYSPYYGYNPYLPYWYRWAHALDPERKPNALVAGSRQPRPAGSGARHPRLGSQGSELIRLNHPYACNGWSLLLGGIAATGCPSP
jgi:hypothetical protein